MLSGCVPWDEKTARYYREKGYWEDIGIADMVERGASAHPEKLAIVAGDKRIAYGQMMDVVNRLACRLVEAGLRATDRVVIQLPNSPNFIYSYLALTRIGAIPVMALRAHRHTEVRHFINASGAVAYFIPDEINNFDYRQMAESLRPECPGLKYVLVDGEAGPGQHSLKKMIEEEVEKERVAEALGDIRIKPDEVATMLLSGGTTSISKLIPRTHNDYVLNARLCGRAADFDGNTVFMAILPLGHNYNLASPGILATFYYGGTVVLAPSGDPDEVFSLVEREGVSVIAAVIPLIANWLNSNAMDKYDLSSLKVIQNGGARLPPDLRKQIALRLGATPQEIFGTAEGLINMTRLDDPEHLLLESSGAPVCEDDEIKVLNEEGLEVKDGELGELVVRGPYTIRGYFNSPEVNAGAFTPDGFYRMGDIVYKEGRYVFAAGRKKDFINRGGEKISCEEVEDIILQHPKVFQTSLVAMPDDIFGERACAFVRTKFGEMISLDELVEFMRSKKIASFKLPERLEVIDEFPVSPVGKILKKQLRENIAAKISAEKEKSLTN